MIGNDIHIAAELLKSGKNVAIPTETVYGLAGNAFNPDAVIGIYEIKKRPLFNPLIAHIGNWEMAERLSSGIPEVLRQLALKFWPGPLTILLPKSDLVHDVVTAGSPNVAIRMPDHKITLELLQLLDFPLAAPSANTFGGISPTTALHVEQQLGNAIPYILDGGASSVGVESTIIRSNTDNKIEILRPGGISAEMLALQLGYRPDIITHSAIPVAPGMLKSHYAPVIPLIVGDITELLASYAGKKVGILSFYKPFEHHSIIHSEQLSLNGELHEAARNLFAAMRRLEVSGAEIILAENVPNHGIGIAINDRLSRASA